jgi:hypothetical protein
VHDASPAPFPDVIHFDMQPDPPSPLAALVDTSFPKGEIFADWLMEVGVSSTQAELSLSAPQRYVGSVSAPAQRWVHSTVPVTIQHLSFNTPLDDVEQDKCGRVLFSNFHVSESGGSGMFPDACPDLNAALTTNERIVEFMLFDTTACVQPDPQPPS